MTVVCRVETRRSALSCAATTARIDAYVSMEFSRPVLKPMGFRECSKSAEFLREALDRSRWGSRGNRGGLRRLA